MTRIGGFRDSMVRICTGEVWVRSSSPVLQEEGVLRVARRMVVREVERLEVVVVVLHLGPLGDAVAELGEDLLHLADDQGHRVEAAERRPAAGEGDVDRRGAPRRLPLALGQLGVELGEARLDRLFSVDRLAVGLAVGGRHLACLCVEERADDALLAADPLQRAAPPRPRGRDRGDHRGGLGLETLSSGGTVSREAGDAPPGRQPSRPPRSRGCRFAVGQGLLRGLGEAGEPRRSRTAMSASTLRSSSEPAAFRPAISRL